MNLQMPKAFSLYSFQVYGLKKKKKKKKKFIQSFHPWVNPTTSPLLFSLEYWQLEDNTVLLLAHSMRVKIRGYRCAVFLLVQENLYSGVRTATMYSLHKCLSMCYIHQNYWSFPNNANSANLLVSLTSALTDVFPVSQIKTKGSSHKGLRVVSPRIKSLALNHVFVQTCQLYISQP